MIIFQFKVNTLDYVNEKHRSRMIHNQNRAIGD